MTRGASGGPSGRFEESIAGREMGVSEGSTGGLTSMSNLRATETWNQHLPLIPWGEEEDTENPVRGQLHNLEIRAFHETFLACGLPRTPDCERNHRVAADFTRLCAFLPNNSEEQIPGRVEAQPAHSPVTLRHANNAPTHGNTASTKPSPPVSYSVPSLFA